jgi:hypothetical protein
MVNSTACNVLFFPYPTNITDQENSAINDAVASAEKRDPTKDQSGLQDDLKNIYIAEASLCQYQLTYSEVNTKNIYAGLTVFGLAVTFAGVGLAAAGVASAIAGGVTSGAGGLTTFTSIIKTSSPSQNQNGYAPAILAYNNTLYQNPSPTFITGGTPVRLTPSVVANSPNDFRNQCTSYIASGASAPASGAASPPTPPKPGPSGTPAKT